HVGQIYTHQDKWRKKIYGTCGATGTRLLINKRNNSKKHQRQSNPGGDARRCLKGVRQDTKRYRASSTMEVCTLTASVVPLIVSSKTIQGEVCMEIKRYS
ncbi:unnamed protein product, partial [Ectocarpus fasciculatus]